jgi:hypothetical protein
LFRVWRGMHWRSVLHSGEIMGRAGWLHRDGQVHYGLKAKGNEPVRVASGHHANDDKSPLMASAKKPNKEIPETRNK